MAAGATYTPIATTTIGTAVASYTFSSISASYTDLIIVVSGIGASTNNLLMQVGNGSVDTGTNYSNTYMYGDGTSAVSGRETSVTRMAVGRVSATNPAPDVIQIMNYSNTTTYKTALNRGGIDITVATVNLWRSTAAINTIKLYPDGSVNFAAGTTLTIYGIAAA
jgi:hypothetical protein